MIMCELPLPPSVNAMKRIARGRSRPYDSPAYRDWKIAARRELDAMHLDPVRGRYELQLRVPQKMQGDIDNRLKPMLDLFVRSGLTDDDKHCAAASVGRDPMLSPKRCSVFIFPESTSVHAAGRGVAGGGDRDGASSISTQ